MGSTYHLWLRDDFGFSGRKDAVEKSVKAVCPHARRVADFQCWLVFDIDKKWPAEFFGKVECDDMLFSGEPSGEDTLPVPVDTLMPKPKPIQSSAEHHCFVSGCSNPMIGSVRLPWGERELCHAHFIDLVGCDPSKTRIVNPILVPDKA